MPTLLALGRFREAPGTVKACGCDGLGKNTVCKVDDMRHNIVTRAWWV